MTVNKSIFNMPFNHQKVRVLASVVVAMVALCLVSQASARESRVTKQRFVETRPSSAGMDAKRLERVGEAMQELIDEGLMAGVVTLGARRNKIVHFEAYGFQNLETKTPMSKDTIFRIYSMSKPVTGVALMMLHEEGKFHLDDPVEKYIPEMADMQVFVREDGGELVTEPADHPMTIRELMSHTGGIAYGSMASPDFIDQKYSEANIFDPDSSLEDLVTKIGKIPLKYQPGTKWNYSASVDIQGFLVEKLSGQRFGDFLQERIFTPLKMVDTAFYVSKDKLGRFAEQYNFDENKNLVAGELFGGPIRFTEDQSLQAGGWGLVSTAMDYAKFAQMLLNGGELNGERLLAPLTVKLMHTNQLAPNLPLVDPSRPPGTSFGLDFAIVEDPIRGDAYSKGEYYWGGAAGTWFWIDPEQEVVFVGMVQHFQPYVAHVRGISKQMFYQAIIDAN